MQSMAYDMRMMRRWARNGQDVSDGGYVTARYDRSPKAVRLAFTPLGRSKRLDVHGEVADETRYRVTCPRGYGFVPGDRLGPADATEPTMEVVTTLDYRTHIRMEVRPL